MFSIELLVAIRGATKHKELVVENHRERREAWRLSAALSRVKELIIRVFSETRLVVVYSARESIT